MNADTEKQRAQVQFLRWVSATNPDVYRRAAVRLRTPKLGDLGFIQAIVQAVAMVGSAVLQKKQQDKAVKLQKAQIANDVAALNAQRDQEAKLALLDVNMKRANSGLPPVDINGKVIPGASLPMPSALAPYAQSLGISSASIGYVAAAGAAVLIIFLVSRRARK